MRSVPFEFWQCWLLEVQRKDKENSISDQHNETAGDLQIYSQNDLLEGFQHPIILSYEVLTEESRFWQSPPSEFGKKSLKLIHRLILSQSNVWSCWELCYWGFGCWSWYHPRICSRNGSRKSRKQFWAYFGATTDSKRKKKHQTHSSVCESKYQRSARIDDKKNT